MARKSAAADRVQIGPYWLEYRAERDNWNICWYDTVARTRRRRATGIGGSGESNPPEAAQKALADHFIQASKPIVAEPRETASLPHVLATWAAQHASTKADPQRYGYSVAHLVRFFATEKAAGNIVDGVSVAHVTKQSLDRFIAFRKREGVGGHTISRDLAALRTALNWAWREGMIESAPFVRDVDAKDKAKPRELTYSMEQVAGLLEAAWGRPERHHVFLYTMIALSTCGRSQAILDLHADQLDRGLIYFLAPGAEQTSKRRSIVPVAPTLAPWLDGLSGKVIRYRAEIAQSKWADPDVPEFFERDCRDLGNAFDACLVEAGICTPVTDAAGKPVILPPRAKLGETQGRPKLKGSGTPNTLRHTIITEMHMRGVDERQIEMAAGHAPIGTNKRNYMHLRPDFLAELIRAVEDYWSEMRRFTTVHLRSHCGPSVVSLSAARADRRQKV